MATHPDQAPRTGRHATLFIFDERPVRHTNLQDLRCQQAAWDEETAEQRRQRRLQRVAVGRATGLTPDQFRRGGTALDRLFVAAGVLLLLYMAIGILIAAAKGVL